MTPSQRGAHSKWCNDIYTRARGTVAHSTVQRRAVSSSSEAASAGATRNQKLVMESTMALFRKLKALA